MAKRRRRIVTWKLYEQFLLDTYTHRRDPGKLSLGSLRGFLIDHPRWGVAARPDVWPNLRRHVRLPAHQEDWSKDLVLQHAGLIAQTLGPSGSTLKVARALIALWGPRGPLRIPRAEWREDPKFQKWLDRQRSR